SLTCAKLSRRRPGGTVNLRMPAGRSQPPSTLSDDDARILGLESPLILGHTGKLFVTAAGDAPLDLGRLRERVARGAEAMPMAKRRVILEGGTPAWADDAD